MAGSGEGERLEKGLSTRYLLMVFLAGVAVCAVFFSLGFLVGYNERSLKVVPVTENVTGSSSVIPPTINPPTSALGTSSSTSFQPPGAGSADQISTESIQLEKSQKAQAPAPVNPPSAQTAVASPAPGVGQPATSAKPESSSPGQSLAVQVTALRDRAEAEALVKTLKRRGFAAFLLTPQAAHSSDKLFRVLVGPFATRQEAEKAQAKLSRQGYRTFIKH